MYSGVPMQLAELGEEGALGERLARRLGQAEVDDLGRGPAALLHRHQDVGGLQIAMDDPLLVGVLDALADLDDEVEAILGGEAVAVAVGRDGIALHELHGEEGTTLRRLSGIEHLGHARDGS